jgi:hypothetical protein
MVGCGLGPDAVDRRLVETGLGDARARIVHTTVIGASPMRAKLRVCEPIHSDRPCEYVASA